MGIDIATSEFDRVRVPAVADERERQRRQEQRADARQYLQRRADAVVGRGDDLAAEREEWIRSVGEPLGLVKPKRRRAVGGG